MKGPWFVLWLSSLPPSTLLRGQMDQHLFSLGRTLSTLGNLIILDKSFHIRFLKKISHFFKTPEMRDLSYMSHAYNLQTGFLASAYLIFGGSGRGRVPCFGFLVMRHVVILEWVGTVTRHVVVLKWVGCVEEWEIVGVLGLL